MGECLPSTLCSHLLPLFKAQSGFYEVLGAPLINPDVGKIFKKSLTKYIRLVGLMKMDEIYYFSRISSPMSSTCSVCDKLPQDNVKSRFQKHAVCKSFKPFIPGLL